MSPVYYRLYLDRDDLLTVVCMQDFDENDYTEHRFLKDKKGERFLFAKESDAIAHLNNNFPLNKIDTEYRSPNNTVHKDTYSNDTGTKFLLEINNPQRKYVYNCWTTAEHEDDTYSKDSRTICTDNPEEFLEELKKLITQ